jgi:hypothetical protein
MGFEPWKILKQNLRKRNISGAAVHPVDSVREINNTPYQIFMV